MRRRLWNFLHQPAAGPVVAALATAMVLVACGGGGGGGGTGGGGGGGGGGGTDTTPPTATLSQTDAVLPKTAPIVVRFSESMNPASLQLGGSLAGEGAGVWARTSADNDTYILSPPATGWTSGPDRGLTVAAKDPAGNDLATIHATYLVKLVFDNFRPAAVVIGQADFSGILPNRNGAPAANTLKVPSGNPAVAPDGKLFIGDTFNNRVLAYSAVPTANDANASFVLGQPNFTSDGQTVAQSAHPGAKQVAIASGKFVVTDSAGHRVIIYNSIPGSGTAEQSVVVGQSGFNSSTPACDAASLNGPEAATITPNGKLIVADTLSSRVLIWNDVPNGNDQPADVVLGQVDFAHCAQNDDNFDGQNDGKPTGRTLSFPSGIWSDGTRLVVNDTENNRVLIWNQIPTSNFQPADVVLGQATFTRGSANDDNQDGLPDAAPSERTFATPYLGVASNGMQLAVADSGNNRVLVWNSFPTSNFQAADVVLGQAGFGRAAGNDDDQDGISDGTGSARVLSSPRGLLFHRDRLIVVDANSRVLVFRSK